MRGRGPELQMTGQDQKLTREQKRRLPEFIAPLTVEPGSRVKLSRDFDPSLTGCIKKTGRRRAAGEGIRPLSEYQA
jgi:hypothetical protein